MHRSHVLDEVDEKKERLIEPSAAGVPLDIYDVHDGWVDELGFMGPLRSEDWYPLGSDPKKPSGQFLVVFQNGGGAELGFDLRTRPHPCYTLQPGEKPQANADPCGAIDTWIAGQLEDLKSSSE